MGLVLLAAPASAGTFKDDIVIDGNFADWAGVDVLEQDPVDNDDDVDYVDFADVQVANNNDFLYLHVTYHTAKAVGSFLAVDNDNNTSTGYNIFWLGLVGSEAGWQNDYPFDQRTDFNCGDLTNGAATLAPAWNVDAFEKEYAIPRAATFTNDGEPVFPNDDITLLFWTDIGFDVTAAIPYTFAVPEPASIAVLAGGSLLLARRRGR